VGEARTAAHHKRVKSSDGADQRGAARQETAAPKEDHEIENQLCTQTYTDQHGVVYSKGNDHINDAYAAPCCAAPRNGRFYDPVEIKVDVSPVRLTRKFYG
jgi:hypothetical protein